MKRTKLAKRSSIGKLRNMCDKKMQELGKKKFPKSIISGLPTQVLHHFFPKSVSSFHRYNWDNLIPLTNSEHFQHHIAGNPQIHAVIIATKGQKWYNNLNKHKRDYVKINSDYYILMFEKLQL